jgi:hypothetical protein
VPSSLGVTGLVILAVVTALAAFTVLLVIGSR